MPELPDIELYCFKLREAIVGQRLLKARIFTPFLVRTVTPTPAELEGKTVTEVRRLGKRIVIGFEGGLFLVLHLMIAGRLRWFAKGAKVPACALVVNLLWFDYIMRSVA